jgi:hypothetical protein
VVAPGSIGTRQVSYLLKFSEEKQLHSVETHIASFGIHRRAHPVFGEFVMHEVSQASLEPTDTSGL